MAWKETNIDMDENGEFEGEFWEPDVNDTLEGTLAEEPKKGKYNKLFLKVRDSEGTIWITSQHAHLDKQIKKLKVVEGDEVRVTYLGMGEQQEDSEYSAPNLYKLQVWRDD